MRRALLLLATSAVLLTCGEPAGPELADHVIVNGPSTLFVGESRLFSALPIGRNGDTLSSRPIFWFSGDTSIALVSLQGYVITRAVGQLGINARIDGKVGVAMLTVNPLPVARVDVTPTSVDSMFVGDSIQFTATPRDATGALVTGRSVTWATSDTTKATVSAAGFVRTRGAGSFTVTATTDGKTGGVFLYAQLRVVSLTMPESLTIGRHHQVRLVADLRSASGTHLARPVTWTSSNTGILEVSGTGILTPRLVGNAVVTARAGEFVDSTSVTVVPESVVRVALAYLRDPMPGDTTLDALLALPYDEGDGLVEGRTFTWTSSDTTIALVRPNPTNSAVGQVTSLAPGIALLTATADGVSGSLEVRVKFGAARFVAQPDSMMLAVGQRRQIFGNGFDRFGNRVDVSGYPQTFAVQDTSIARMDYSAFIPFVQPLQPGRTTVIVQLSNALADTVPVIVPTTGRPLLRWVTEVVEPYSYSPWSVVLEAFDSAGMPATVPREVRLVSSDTTVVVGVPALLPSMTAAETVAVQSRRAGVATLTAISDSTFAILDVTVSYRGPSGVEINPTPSAMIVGDTLQLRATVLDVNGMAQPYVVTWTTTNATRAVVSDSGLVTAVGVGAVAVIASSGGKSDTVSLAVLSPDAPTISEVRPALLHPGDTATLLGTGFSPDQSVNTVLIEGLQIPTLSAADSAITFVMPPANAWACAPTHPVKVLVNSGGRFALDSATISVATPRTLDVGQTLLLTENDASCNDFGGGGNYDLVVANANEGTPTSVEIHFLGQGPTPTPPPTPGEEDGPSARGMPSAGPSVSWSPDSLRRAAAMHRRLLEGNRALAARAGPAPALLRAARRLRPQLSVTATINGIAEIRVPRLEDPNFCASSRTIRARVVYAGARALILEDVVAPLAGQMDTYYQALGQEFDNVMYPKLLENFGDPLALDSLLDGDGRIAMVFSPLVNSYGVGGFVVTCDFYPESVAPSSNTGEIFYAQTPTGPLHGFTGYSADVWRWLTRTVVMHETKHLTAYAERLSRGAPLEDTWLEEASAVLAEELWARGIYGTSWKGDATYRQTLYCDVRPSFPECADRPYSMFNAFAFLYDYALRYNNRTPLGPSALDDASFYGSGWALLRWTVDHHATSEGAFLKALVTEPTLTGVANLEARAGRPFGDLLPQWGMALYKDAWSQPSPDPALSFSSWKLEDVFIGMAVDFPDSFLDGGHPLRVRSLVNGFPYQFAPGSWVLFSFGGYSTQLLEARGPGGAPLGAGARLYVNRGP